MQTGLTTQKKKEKVLYNAKRAPGREKYTISTREGEKSGPLTKRKAAIEEDHQEIKGKW